MADQPNNSPPRAVIIVQAAPPAKYANVEDVTLLVELKNVGEKPVVLQGTRYGDSVSPPAQGKSASDSFAPFLFDCEFFDSQGTPIDRPSRKMLDVDSLLTLSGGSAETIAPGQSLVTLIRPTKWDASLWRHMNSGDYRIRVHYRGPGAGVLKEMQRVWPDKPLASVWSGDVVSPLVSFKIVRDQGSQPPELVWSDPVDGLQAAVEFLSESKTAQARRDTGNVTFPTGARLAVHLHVKNVGAKAISFSSETWRQDDKITLIDEAGKETQVAHSWYGGWPRTEQWTLKSGQISLLSCITLGIAADDEAAKNFDHPIAAAVVPKPGKYWLRYDLDFGRLKRTDKDGKPLIPGDNDWQGTLSTGATMIRVRERRPEDEPPTFSAQLEFRQPDGQRIEQGEFEVFVQSKGRSLLKGELQPGMLVVPECPFETLMVKVRAPGFEETRFLDVIVQPKKVTPLTLTPAEPVRFRLVADDGKPVAGAQVRYLNRSKFDASAGPYPLEGLKGEVWATSNDNGEVSWHHAESKPLEVLREGGKLEFNLSRLRPGKLRIVSRFKQGGKPVSHVYSRREPNEDDVVCEINLTETRDDLVVQNKGDKPAPKK